MRWLKRLHNWLEGQKAITYLLLFLIAITFFIWMQYSPDFSDPDSFYHTRVAELMSQEGPVIDFPYLQLTTLKDSYTDHHFIYHLYLVPFVNYLPPLIGVKLAQAILDALVIITFFWLLRRLGVRGAFWYSLLLFISPSFIFRISLVKAQPLALILFFIGIYLIVMRKHWWLLALAFIYVWSYGGWILLLISASLYVLMSSWDLAERESNKLWQKLMAIRRGKLLKTKDVFLSFFKKIFGLRNIKLIVYILVGFFLGIIANPYFPNNLSFYWDQVVQIGMVNYQSVIGVGSEWYPLPPLDFIRSILRSLILMVGAVILFLHYRKRFNGTVKYLFVLMLFFFLATIKARRNLEYLIPSIIIFSAVVYSASYQTKRIAKDLMIAKESLITKPFKYLPIRIFLTTVMVFVLIYTCYDSVITTKDNLSSGLRFDYLKGSSQFIGRVSQPGDIVFHSDWDDFPSLFYHNSNNYYIIGLDPTFMYLYNKDLYHQWADITQGKRYQKLYDIIKNNFGAKYVIATLDHQSMIDSFDNNFYFKKIYQDSEAVVYVVL